MLAAILIAISLSTAPNSQEPVPDTHRPSADAPKNAPRMAWWRDSRFGMFIHWGPVSLKGTEIGWSRGAEVPIEEYDKLYKQFNPTKFDADAWVKLAKDAGMKYVIFTTKHHDGFCMFDTKQTDFNVMNSPFGRDVVKELSQACKRQGMAFGTYHSVCDWHHPDFPLGSPGGNTKKPNPNLDRYEQYLRKQVEELIRNYGPLCTMWFDVPQEFDAKRGQGVVDFVRSLQPDILINNRCVVAADFDTPEQTVGRFQTNRPWESCITICNQWAWKPDDRMKSLKECVQTLVRCAGGDGNLLFNVGPMPTGEIEPRQAQRLREMGAWLKRFGRTVYATRGGPFRPGAWGCSTSRGSSIFLHVLNPDGGSLKLPSIPRKIVSSAVLTGGDATVRQTKQGTEVSLPPASRQEIDTIVELRLDGPAADIRPISIGGALTSGRAATASNVFQQMGDYAAACATDDDESTRWATDGGTKSAWLEVDLGAETVIGRLRIVQEAEYASRVRRFELQVKRGDRWQSILAGTTMGADFAQDFPAVSTRFVRFAILEATDGPTINEFQIFPPRK